MVQGINLVETNAAVLGEETEMLAVFVKVADVDNVLVNFEQFSILRCRNEKRTSVSPFNCVLKRGSSVVGC